MIKIMSFNVRSDHTWDYNNNPPISKTWVNYFSEIVNMNKPDIIFLQEVNTEEDALSVICNTLGADWNFKDTSVYSKCRNKNLNNAVLYNDKITCIDITNRYSSEEFQNINNNLQILEFSIAERIIIGVNVHLKSEKRNMNKNGEHGEEVRKICNLLVKLQEDYPLTEIFAIGDYNFSNDFLLDIIKNELGMADYFLDEDDELIAIETNGKGVQTTVTGEGFMGNAMDHFLCNAIMKNNVKKQNYNNSVPEEPWSVNCGVLHVVNPNNPPNVPDIKIGNLRIIPATQYYQEISDHYPITVHIL